MTKLFGRFIAISMINSLLLLSMIAVYALKNPEMSSPAVDAQTAFLLPTVSPVLIRPKNSPSVQPEKISPAATPANTLTVQVPQPEVKTSITSDRCLIKVDEGTYDVTEFRAIHQGGNIFQCGTNMSAIFHSQHDANTLQKFQRYRAN